jgi:hypothetical protein
MSEPGITYSAQCYGHTCVQAPPNLACEYLGTTCQTIVAGFAAGEMEKKVKPLFTGVFGIAMSSVGEQLASEEVEEGAVLTHVNNQYIGGGPERAAALTANLSKGDVLTFLAPDGTRRDITL